jgi:CRISPR-associated protein Cmr4
LPPESIFYAPVMAEPVRGGTAMSKLDTGKKVLDEMEMKILAEKFLQVGGNETLGQGWCAVCLLKGGVAS